MDPIKGLSYSKVGDWNEYQGTDRQFVDLSEADVVNSLVAQNVEFNRGKDFSMHYPILDIDMPVRVTESSTPGHHHLYIAKPMQWWEYMDLMQALAKAGIVQPGYVAASIERGYSSCRLPWIKKV